MPIVKHVGEHSIGIEGDVVFARFVGDQKETELRELLAVVHERFGTNPWYVIVDSHKIGKVEPSARKYFSQWVAEHNQSGCVVYGATVITRTFAILVQGAMRMLGNKIIPLAFVNNHEEAQAWIEEHRKKNQSSR
jgi:hypothetical protein